jgi:hypothetical protein
MFPETGVLQTVILPSTLKQFRIYNNPGLTEVIFEDHSNIKNVYIDCAKCGVFNVEEFIENLSNNTLESVTLRNAKLSLTEEALRNLLYAKNCIIEGTITIINSIEDRTPKNISFNTK